jgi:hypothetical protein
MPCLNQELLVLFDHSFDPANFMIGKTVVLGKLRRVQPELGDVPIPFDVNVRRLTSIRAEKHEPVRTDRENCWHPISPVRNKPV